MKKTLLHITLILIGILTLAPLLWMVSASLMPAGEANTFPPKFIPDNPTLEHYRTLFTRLNLLRYILNSVVVSVSITLISLLVNSMAGFAFAKFHFPGRDTLFKTLLSAMIIS